MPRHAMLLSADAADDAAIYTVAPFYVDDYTCLLRLLRPDAARAMPPCFS